MWGEWKMEDRQENGERRTENGHGQRTMDDAGFVVETLPVASLPLTPFALPVSGGWRLHARLEAGATPGNEHIVQEWPNDVSPSPENPKMAGAHPWLAYLYSVPSLLAASSSRAWPVPVSAAAL
jgi:hypothetical protein